MNLSKFYIDGDWVDPIEPNSIPVINPASEESIGNVSIGSKEDVDKLKIINFDYQISKKNFDKKRHNNISEIRKVIKTFESRLN